MGKPLLTVENLTMRFGGLIAVNDVSFTVHHGEIFGLIGPNGAGKTTVFNCLTQFYKPTKGTLTLHLSDKDVALTALKPHQVIQYGVIRSFQNVELAMELTVLENLLVTHTSFLKGSLIGSFFPHRKLALQEKQVKEKALNILSFLGLYYYKDAYPVGLPYGVLKTIELARTLMIEPRLIILDEPAAGLNESETLTLAQHIRFIRDVYQTTIILVEHDMDLVMSICDQIAVLNFGKRIGFGTPAYIQSLPEVRAAYLGSEQ
jgi:branched-chain amino acid transport system ATP-binding protein